jgi:hypothetical protein
VRSVINEIDGYDHARTQHVGVPQQVTLAETIRSGA